MIRRICSSFFVLAFLVMLAPRSSAQALDGLWFKVTASIKGGGVDETGFLFSVKGKVVAYMFLQMDDAEPEGTAPSTLYTAAIYSEVTPGNWQQVSGTTFLALGDDENALVGPSLGNNDDGVELLMGVTADGNEGEDDFIRVHFIARTKIKTDKEGNTKKASFKSFGAVVPEGVSDGDTLFGGGKVSGKSIDPSKLPFPVVQ